MDFSELWHDNKLIYDLSHLRNVYSSGAQNILPNKCKKITSAYKYPSVRLKLNLEENIAI